MFAPEPVEVLGIPIVPFGSYSEAVKCAADNITSGKKSFWVAVNPQKIYRAMHDRRLRFVLTHADVGICDGIGVALASKLLNGCFLNRCTGCDLFFELLPLAAEKGWRIFLLGATRASNEGAWITLGRKYPGLKLVGRQDGYFRDSSGVVERINASKADILFVAMGSPRQEYWISEHLDSLAPRFCMGVGGTFNIVSGITRRAPRIFRKTGTEFLYQLLTEPGRWRRQVVYAPYMLKVLHEALFGRSANGGGGLLRAVRKKS